MGGRALTPPTRHRLGEPLPHQLADGPQAPPKAPEGFPYRFDPVSALGISACFHPLSPSLGQVTYVLLTRLPLMYPRRGLIARLACIKRAASVHPEPRSNSSS